MLNHKTIFKQKSKILLVFVCIFGLILYYGCGRDDDGGITDPSSFSISEETGNVKTSIVQSQKTIGELKIGFAASHDYIMDYTVEDSDTTEATKLTKTDFTKSTDNVLTINDAGLGKVRALNTDSGPAEKTITINFTFKANDASLKNNTQTLSVDVTLTKSWQPASGDDSYIGTIFNDSRRNFGWVENNDYDTLIEFPTSSGDYQNKVYTLKSDKNGYTKDIPKSEVKSKFIDLINRQTEVTKYFTVSDSGEEAKIEQTTVAADTVSFTVNLTYTDILEGTTDKITVKFIIASENDTVKFVD